MKKHRISVIDFVEVVQIPADLAGGLHHGEDLDRPLRSWLRKHGRNHAHLQLARRFKLLFHASQMGTHLVAQPLFFEAGSDARLEQNRIKRF